MEKILFDAHAHINEERYSDEEREELARTIEASPLRFVMDAGSCMEDSRRAIKDAETYDWCYASCGVHPEEVGDMTEDTIEELREMLQHPKVKALGEIGLDYHYEVVPREIQQKWFRRQVELAVELGAPIMIHSREADLDTMTILKEAGAFSEERKAAFPAREAAPSAEYPYVSKEYFEEAETAGRFRIPDARVLMHCYSYSAETAREYVKLGATISICGPVTFKSNKKTRRVVREVPIECMTVETDSPYLAPEPMRGRPNMSPYVEYTCRKVAEIKGVPYEEAAEVTCGNAMRFYGIEE